MKSAAGGNSGGFFRAASNGSSHLAKQGRQEFGGYLPTPMSPK
jgi:hypothetical protein